MSFQVRTAATEAELAKSPFVGPDGKTGARFDTPGSAFQLKASGLVQYKIILKTGDPAKTPYVHRVAVTRVE